MSDPTTESLRSPDFLNRDFDSFVGLLARTLDRAGTGWRQRSPADPGMMVVDLLAYELDHLAQAADRVSTESFLRTARLRSSLRMHAALAGYLPCERQSGHGFQHLKLACIRCGGPPCTCARTGVDPLPTVPRGAAFSTLIDGQIQPVVFQAVEDTPVSPDHNLFELVRAVVRGQTRLHLSGKAGPDLRMLRLAPDMRLSIGRDTEAEVVQIDRVGEDWVELRTALRRDHPEGSWVRGNLVLLREGETSELHFTLGLARGQSTWGTFLEARVQELVRASEELELARAAWFPDEALRQRWQRAQHLIDSAVSHLRDTCPVMLGARQGTWQRADDELRRLDACMRGAWNSLDAVARAIGHVWWSPGGLRNYVALDDQRIALGPEFPAVWDGPAPGVEVHTRAPGQASWRAWTVCASELFECTPAERAVLVWVDNRGLLTLQFPDGITGRRPAPGSDVRVRVTWSARVATNPRAERILRMLPESRAALARQWLKLEATCNPTAVWGARGAEGADQVRRAVERDHQWFAAPGTTEDLRALAQRQPGVAEARVQVEGPLFAVTLRLEPQAPETTLVRVRETLERHRQVGTFIVVREAEPRLVRIQVVCKPTALVSPQVTRTQVRERIERYFAGRLGASLGVALTPYDIEAAVQGVAEWTDVFELAYLGTNSASDELLTVAADRYLDLGYDAHGGDSVVVQLARSMSIDIIPMPHVELDALDRQAIYGLLSGPSATLGPIIDARRIERVLRNARIPVRVSALYDGAVRSAGIRLGPDEVPFLESITEWAAPSS